MVIRRKLKRSTKQYLIVALICIVVIGGAAVFTSIIITGQIKEEYEAILREAHQEMERNRRKVFVATADIMAGETITEENIEERIVYASQPVEYYTTKEEVEKVALVDIPAGTQIIQSMLTENHISSELREIEYDVIQISSNITNNDTVDVRIAYPNGESYLVLSKKAIKGLTLDTVTCLFWLDEEELLRMSAAIVDAGLYPGSKLYVTKYIEPSIQKASQVNYVPSLSILSLLESDPNILERCSQELNRNVRKALENRLAASMDLDVSEINWDIHPNPQPRLTEESEESLLSEQLAKTKTSKKSNDPSFQNEQLEDAITKDETGKSQDYLFYAQEKKDMEGDVEYGE